MEGSPVHQDDAQQGVAHLNELTKRQVIEALVARRKELGWPIERVATEADLATATIWKHEHGVNSPGEKVLAKWAEALGMNVTVVPAKYSLTIDTTKVIKPVKPRAVTKDVEREMIAMRKAGKPVAAISRRLGYSRQAVYLHLNHPTWTHEEESL